MSTLLRIATAFAAGAAAMYYFDPATGRRRRAQIRDQAVSTGHDAENFARTTSRRAAGRIQGAVARTRENLSTAPIDDDQLHDRIRARLGHVLDKPGEVNVDVYDGQVVLRGSASTADEIDDVLETVSAMRGVAGIDNRLSMGTGQASSVMP